MNSEKPRLELPSEESVTVKVRDCMEMEEHLLPLKSEINEFLFKWMPDTATVRDVEQLSSAIFFDLHARWEKYVKGLSRT